MDYYVGSPREVSISERTNCSLLKLLVKLFRIVIKVIVRFVSLIHYQ